MSNGTLWRIVTLTMSRMYAENWLVFSLLTQVGAGEYLLPGALVRGFRRSTCPRDFPGSARKEHLLNQEAHRCFPSRQESTTTEVGRAEATTQWFRVNSPSCANLQRNIPTSGFFRTGLEGVPPWPNTARECTIARCRPQDRR